MIKSFFYDIYELFCIVYFFIFVGVRLGVMKRASSCNLSFDASLIGSPMGFRKPSQKRLSDEECFLVLLWVFYPIWVMKMREILPIALLWVLLLSVSDKSFFS